VFGGGDSAALDALALADAGSSVFLVHRSPRLTARRDIIGRLESQPRITEMSGWTLERLIGGDRLEGAAVSDGTTGQRRHLDVERVVLKLGREPMAGLVHGQVELGRHGGVVVDASLRTSHPKAFAAGDVVEGAYERIATAMGQGSLAARSILNSLQSQS
ncbi:MAG: NAD(P)/FAD-dependent oxidoreductase, partial [Acidimicrobiia bacterium]|nr:NAD(P)/FAD-dependent oxidoreductase [Acidimicrobiia bacterium]